MAEIERIVVCKDRQECGVAFACFHSYPHEASMGNGCVKDAWCDHLDRKTKCDDEKEAINEDR